MYDKLFSKYTIIKVVVIVVVVAPLEDVTASRNQEIHTNTEVMANRPDIAFKNRKRKCSC
jgi:hypothetical protein